MVASHGYRWFDAHPVDIVMTTGPSDSNICISDEKKEPLDHPCYWVPKKGIRE